MSAYATSVLEAVSDSYPVCRGVLPFLLHRRNGPSHSNLYHTTLAGRTHSCLAQTRQSHMTGLAVFLAILNSDWCRLTFELEAALC